MLTLDITTSFETFFQIKTAKLQKLNVQKVFMYGIFAQNSLFLRQFTQLPKPVGLIYRTEISDSSRDLIIYWKDVGEEKAEWNGNNRQNEI